jgi:hypothetical protein
MAGILWASLVRRGRSGIDSRLIRISSSLAMSSSRPASALPTPLVEQGLTGARPSPAACPVT